MKLKFLDLFAGIGGFRLGMEQAGHECIGFCEIDKFARKSYKAMHDTKGEVEWHDITTVTDEHIRPLRGRVDVICGGFPCQAFSVAGKRGGFDDTRGTLFFEIARIADILRPRYLFLENVKGLLSHDGGATFETILRTLDELGYDAEWEVLNSKDFGVPQNRERVFIIGHLRGTGGRKVFPIGGEGGKTTYEGQKDEGEGERICPTISTSPNHSDAPYVIKPVLTPDRPEKRQNGRRFKEDGEPMFTLTSQDRHGVMVVGNVNPSSNGMNGQVYKSEGLSPTLTTNKGEGPKIQTDYRIRKLTPKECFRLQGFPDWAFNRAAKVNSDSQLYKQAGNSVTVNVIHEIARRLHA